MAENLTVDQLLIDSPGGVAKPEILVLAHGAGAPMDSSFMNTMTELLVGHGICVVRFEFPYMQERRSNGKRRPPNREAELLGHWRLVMEWLAERFGGQSLYIGGKSMGGRMASLLADELEVAGLVCLGYPFHPQGKPERLRTAHLADLACSTLIVQGTRDALGSREEVAHYDLSDAIQLCWLEDGDHDLKPRVKSGFTHEEHLIGAAAAIARFVG